MSRRRVLLPARTVRHNPGALRRRRDRRDAAAVGAHGAGRHAGAKRGAAVRRRAGHAGRGAAGGHGADRSRWTGEPPAANPTGTPAAVAGAPAAAAPTTLPAPDGDEAGPPAATAPAAQTADGGGGDAPDPARDPCGWRD